jgi:putative acetyltransferase
MDGVTLRLADADDIAAVAGLFARSRAVALPFLPVLHSPAEDIAFFASRRENARMTLAVRGPTPVGFMVETEGWIEHLYLEPEQRGQGLGSLLVNAAKQRQERLQLWCFVDNHAGRAFYARHGFVEIARTVGDNEERQPDILFGWPRQD